MNEPFERSKKYPGPKTIAKRIKPLAEWLRANKPTCKTITATHDDMIGLRKAKLNNLTGNGFYKHGDEIGYAEFVIHAPPTLERLPYFQDRPQP